MHQRSVPVHVADGQTLSKASGVTGSREYRSFPAQRGVPVIKKVGDPWAGSPWPNKVGKYTATVHCEQSPLPPDADEVTEKRFWSVAIHTGESTLGQGRDLQEVGKRAHLASVCWSQAATARQKGQHDSG